MPFDSQAASTQNWRSLRGSGQRHHTRTEPENGRVNSIDAPCFKMGDYPKIGSISGSSLNSRRSYHDNRNVSFYCRQSGSTPSHLRVH